MKENALNYFGKIDEHCIVEFVDLLNGILTRNLGARKDLRKICSFAIELLDNGMRYSVDDNISFSWVIQNDHITFELQNRAQEDDAFRLREQADMIKSFSEEEKNNEFRKVMLEPHFGKKGGAGLGLLQMLRKGAVSIDVHVDVSALGEYVCICKIVTPIKKF
ncbi:MAG: hypothetical protein K1X54_02120 [Flavobacteriales bacterium]|nr:hypothetical protein [Flavobacteriales bacterium]